VSLTELRARLEGRRGELSALRVAVLAGGGSSEREVSLRSGRAVLNALLASGHQAELLELSPDNLTLEPGAEPAEFAPLVAETSGGFAPAVHGAPLASGNSSALQVIRQCDIVLTMLHGSHGENGAWQGLLELARVPYVSAGVKGSALAMDKIVSKRLFEQLSIPTPRWWVAHKDAEVPEIPPDVLELVAKPPLEGSSVGIEMVPNDSVGWSRIRKLNERYDRLLIEERIKGRELTVGLIGASSDPVALPIVEIVAGNEYYDYEAKYGGKSSYICPADLAPTAARSISAYATTVYREFDLGPFARVDCLLDEQEQPWFLEANTLPGFTELSLLPMAAKAAGIEMGELLDLLMLCALERNEAHGVGS
jgi:D-alanine-D-alanine ligase